MVFMLELSLVGRVVFMPASAPPRFYRLCPRSPVLGGSSQPHRLGFCITTGQLCKAGVIVICDPLAVPLVDQFSGW